MLSYVNEADLMKFQCLNRIAAQDVREAPLCILVYSPPSCGKTLFINFVESLYGRFHGLNIDANSRYTRNLCEEYMSGYLPSNWSMVMDDLAFENPNLMVGGRTSTSEIIQIANNVATLANMAEIEKKGNTPIIPKLVQATTNVKHLNAHISHAVPYAVNRRFPYVINLCVKSEYANDNGELDSSRLPSIYNVPDFWIIIVEKPILPGKGRICTFDRVAYFDNSKDFILWFKDVMSSHDAIQKSIVTKASDLRKLDYCWECGMALVECTCDVTPQIRTVAVVGDRMEREEFVEELHTAAFIDYVRGLS